MDTIPRDAVRETWDSVFEKSVRLAGLIAETCRQSGERFDAVVVVPRGSYYPVNIIARELGFSATDLLHACLSSYADDSTERSVDFTLGQMPSDTEVRGKQLLIVEEVCDTGHTLQFLHERFLSQGAALVRSAVLHYKPAQSQTAYAPDWFVEETDKWIVYPWEQHENRGTNLKRDSV